MRFAVEGLGEMGSRSCGCRYDPDHAILPMAGTGGLVSALNKRLCVLIFYFFLGKNDSKELGREPRWPMGLRLSVAIHSGSHHFLRRKCAPVGPPFLYDYIDSGDEYDLRRSNEYHDIPNPHKSLHFSVSATGLRARPSHAFRFRLRVELGAQISVENFKT